MRNVVTVSMLRRFVLLTAAVLTVLLVGSVVIETVSTAPPGDYETRKGDILLSDGKWDEAIIWFERAMVHTPHHRGAMMGRAIALMQMGNVAGAEAAFDALIATLTATLAADDATGRAVLAGAFANRGILHDRSGRYSEALADYRSALAIDNAAVAGPGLGHRILYANARPASVAKRADYLDKQLHLPRDQQRMRLPEVDARQRMHKP